MQSLSHLTTLTGRAPLNTLQLGASAKANATSSTNSTTSSADGIGTTFLNLLTQELQNQDPTAPVDSTAMVGQMISLNQLDQLIAINQTLGQAQTSSTTSGAQLPAGAPGSVAAKSQSTTAASNASTTQQLPFDPQTMMPVDINHPGGLLAPNIPGLNSGTWNAAQNNTLLNAIGRK